MKLFIQLMPLKIATALCYLAIGLDSTSGRICRNLMKAVAWLRSFAPRVESEEERAAAKQEGPRDPDRYTFDITEWRGQTGYPTELLELRVRKVVEE